MQPNSNLEDWLYWRYKEKPKTNIYLKWGSLILFVALLGLPFFSNAESECLILFYETPEDATVRPYKAFYTDSVKTGETCHEQNQGFVLTEPVEFALLKQSAESNDSFNNIILTLNELFEFSAEDFAYLTALFLVAVISGHATGRVVRVLGKT